MNPNDIMKYFLYQILCCDLIWALMGNANAVSLLSSHVLVSPRMSFTDLTRPS